MSGWCQLFYDTIFFIELHGYMARKSLCLSFACHVRSFPWPGHRSWLKCCSLRSLFLFSLILQEHLDILQQDEKGDHAVQKFVLGDLEVHRHGGGVWSKRRFHSRSNAFLVLFCILVHKPCFVYTYSSQPRDGLAVAFSSPFQCTFIGGIHRMDALGTSPPLRVTLPRIPQSLPIITPVYH
jgi:hypothetical protein